MGRLDSRSDGHVLSVENGGIAAVACCPAAGMEWVQGTGACQPCDAGKYADKVDGEEVYKCVACAAGTYSEAGPFQTSAEVCEPCAAGTYSESPGQTSASNCTECGPGLYSNMTGQSAAGSCKDCAAGRYTNTSGQLKCEPCAAGREAGSGRSTNCSACDPGQYQVEAGQAACVQCPKGEYQNATGAIACKECDLNHFANETSQHFCRKCPIGKTSPEASASCQSSAPGKLEMSLACRQDCQPGRFRENLDDTADSESTSCSTCPKGWYQDEPQKGFCLPCVPW